MAIRLASVLAVLGLAIALTAAVAGADGDPASDVLLGESVFYPYMPPVSGAAEKRLNAETAAAKRAGFPIKVALIASPIDLGVIPSLFNRPQKYADFLDAEISFQGKQPLLVVMPAGFGAQGLPAATRRALSSLRPPAGKGSTQLAEAAIAAVPELAAAASHRIRDGSGGPGTASGGSRSTSLIVIALVAAAAVAVTALIVLRRRAPPR